MNKNVLIKSVDRQSGSSHAFVYETQCLLDGCYILKNLQIANTIYNINSDNNTFILNDGTDKNITISIGNYTVNSLKTAVEDELNLISAGTITFTVTFSSTTGKFTIVGTSNFTLIFPDANTASTYGFTDLSVTGTTITADKIVNLSYPSSIGVDITESNVDNYENGSTLSSGSIYVPLNESFGFYKTLDDNNFPQYLNFKNCRYLNISVINTSNNKSIDLNGSDFELLLSKMT